MTAICPPVIAADELLIPVEPPAQALDALIQNPKANSAPSIKFPGLAKKLTLDIREMEVNNFLKFLAAEGGLNIVVSKDVSGTVNLLISDVSIGDALEIVLSLNALAYEFKGTVIKVITNKEYKERYGVDFYDQRKTVVFQLKYASAKNLGTMLGSVKSDIGKVIYDEGTGALVLMDTPDKIKEMEGVINKEELPTVNRVLPTVSQAFELKFTKAADIKDEVTKELTPDIGNIRVDTRTNTLMITDLPHQMEKVVKLIQAFDKKKKQVFIEAKIVEATLTDALKWGIDWDRIISVVNMGKTVTKTFKVTPEVVLPLGLTNSYNKITVASGDAHDLDIALEMLSSVTETKILSNPHLAVEDGQEAKIEVIEKQPYQEETTTTASGGTTTSSKTYQWVNVGVTFHVTPKINEEGFITMLIKPEVSSISSWYGGLAQASGAVPVVKTASAETTVTIKDGVTLVIAGLIKDQKTVSTNKLPLMGDLPLIGWLFKSTSDDIRRTETLVFLTPRLIEGDEQFMLERDMPKQIKGLDE